MKAKVWDNWDKCYHYLHNYKTCIEKDRADGKVFMLGFRHLYDDKPEDELFFATFIEAKERLIQFYKHSTTDRFTEYYVVDDGRLTKIEPWYS